MIGFLLILTAAAFAISLALTSAMVALSPRLGLVAHPGAHRTHAQPTPKGGGVAIFIAFWTPVLAGLLACVWLNRSGGVPPFWPGLDEYVRGVVGLAPRLGMLFGGGLAIWLLGLADDRWNLSPFLRLFIEIVIAVGLALGGLRATLFFESSAINVAITAVWIVGIINAFNWLDNMDGLSAGVGAIIAFFIAIVAVQTGHWFVAAFLACLVGALGGFLTLNFPPAFIFMGDNGSTLLGYLLAVITVEFTFFTPERPYFPVVMPLLLFGLPLFDMTTVVWIRLRNGKSPFLGDNNHFSHRLVALGMTPRQAVLTIYLVAATVALGATVLYYANTAAILVILAQTVAVFTIIGILERARPNKTRETRD